MKENFSNLAKEIRLPWSLGSPDSPKQVGPKEAHTNIIIMLPKIKDKERILEAAKRKGHSYLQRSSHKTINWFLKRNLAGKKGLERSIQSHERQGPTSKIILSSKAII